jgi:hypothetical protein
LVEDAENGDDLVNPEDEVEELVVVVFVAVFFEVFEVDDFFHEGHFFLGVGDVEGVLYVVVDDFFVFEVVVWELGVFLGEEIVVEFVQTVFVFLEVVEVCLVQTTV